MRFNWKKFFAGACLSLTLLMPQAQAAEPMPEESAANWQLIRNALELSSQQKSFDSSVETKASVQATEGTKFRLTITAKGSSLLSNNKNQVSHSTGTYQAEIQLNDFNNTYSGGYEQYSEGKGKKFTSYTKEGEGWISKVTELDPEFVKLFHDGVKGYVDMIQDSADAVLVEEKENIAEIKMVPHPGMTLPEITTVVKDKKFLDLWNKVSPFLADLTPENIEIHVFIDRKTGAMTGVNTSLSKWLKDELVLLSRRPEIASVPMLKGIDLSSLDCSLTMESRMNPVTQDFTVTVPKEVKKNAKRSK
ncbi:MAG: hypothetical protein Q4D07_06075 [Selenomonadaceae bacterium]|nr:hypothetical protein [Selenomonadaceae bacterium]